MLEKQPKFTGSKIQRVEQVKHVHDEIWVDKIHKRHTTMKEKTRSSKRKYSRTDWLCVEGHYSVTQVAVCARFSACQFSMAEKTRPAS